MSYKAFHLDPYSNSKEPGAANRGPVYFEEGVKAIELTTFSRTDFSLKNYFQDEERSTLTIISLSPLPDISSGSSHWKEIVIHIGATIA